MTAIGYVRVSTADQADNGYGLDVQRHAIETYCADHGLVLAGSHCDAGISGASNLDQRPGLASALAAAEAAPGGQLIVYRLDRLARDLVLQELILQRLTKYGTGVMSVTEPDLDTTGTDPTKILIRQILGALGQYERALIRGRMHAGRAAKAAVGGYVGGAPGYGRVAVGGQLVVNDAEHAAVQLVRTLRSQGETYRSICTALEQAGHRPRRASRWHPAVVREIARRSAYAEPRQPRRLEERAIGVSRPSMSDPRAIISHDLGTGPTR